MSVQVRREFTPPRDVIDDFEPPVDLDDPRDPAEFAGPDAGDPMEYGTSSLAGSPAWEGL